MVRQPEGERPEPLAGEREHRVGDRRGDGRGPGLADAAHLGAALDDVDLDLRHLVDAQHAVVVEVALLDPAVLEGDGAVERRAEAEGDAALHLGLDAERVHRLAAVDGADHPVHPDLPGAVDRDLGHLGDEAAERVVDREPRARPARRRRAPAGLVRGDLEHVGVAGGLAEERRAGTPAGPCRRRGPARRSCSPSRRRCGCCPPSATRAPGWAASGCGAITFRAGTAARYGESSDALDRGCRRCRSSSSASKGVPARSDWPTTVCFQATGRPFASRPTCDAVDGRRAGSSRRGCRPRASRRP